MSKLERASYFKDWVDSEKEGDAHNTKHGKSMQRVLNQTPVAKGSLKRKLNRKTRVANRMGRYEEEDEDFERSNGPNRPRKRKSEYDEMGKRSKKHTTPTENLKNKKAKNKLGNSAIFSGANTINFTKNGNGTDTVTPMGASAQDIKTAYRKASLNA